MAGLNYQANQRKLERQDPGANNGVKGEKPWLASPEVLRKRLIRTTGVTDQIFTERELLSKLLADFFVTARGVRERILGKK